MREEGRPPGRPSCVWACLQSESVWSSLRARGVINPRRAVGAKELGLGPLLREASMRIPAILLIWVVVGVIVAITKDYGDSIDSASEIATFILAVVLWPIPATGGQVGIVF